MHRWIVHSNMHFKLYSSKYLHFHLVKKSFFFLYSNTGAADINIFVCAWHMCVFVWVIGHLFVYIYMDGWWYNMYLSKPDKQEIKAGRAEELAAH